MLDYILSDFRNAPFYIHCLFHIIDLRMFSLSFYPLAKWTIICHDFDLLMLFILTYSRRKCFQQLLSDKFEFDSI